jgi:hypothetical protein
MPIHDCTKVGAGIFHDFHCAWIVELPNMLNGGLLPSSYYALAEQMARPVVPGLPQESEVDLYAKKANRIAIRHASDDRVIAIVEILSPGKTSSKHAIDELLDKVWSIIDQSIHLLLIDLFQPTPRDPQGMHALIWGDSAQGRRSDSR